MPFRGDEDEHIISNTNDSEVYIEFELCENISNSPLANISTKIFPTTFGSIKLVVFPFLWYNTLMIIDTHAHLNDENLIERAENIVADMEKDGLTAIINVGYDLPSSLKAVELAKKHEKLFAVVGMHPHDSKSATAETYEIFRELSTYEKTVAIGEIGLDYHYDLSPRETQKKVFLEQLVMAHELKLPTVIHLREAYGDMSEILRNNKRYTEYGILLHCYGGSKETASELIKNYDAYFSFGGAITFKNATEKPEIIRSVPLNRILTETDCPYMTPVPFRGRQNEPKYVNLVVDKLAEILGKDRDFIAETTTRNALDFFGKMKKILSL